jgi:signal transduction histidine kinase
VQGVRRLLEGRDRRPMLVLAVVLAPFIAADVAVTSIEGGVVGPGADALAIAVALVLCVAVAVTDVRPRAGVVGAAGAFVALAATGRVSSLAAFVVLATVAAAAYRSDGRGVAVALPAGIVALAVTPVVVNDVPATANTATNAAIIVAVVLAGISARTQRRYAAELETRARELERLRATETREAIAEERLRIAREVHDAVGHALAAITLQARVATRRLSRDPAAVAGALADISELAASALGDTREAVGQLRTPDGPVERPQHGLDELDELVAALRAPDLQVSLRREGGDPPAPAAVQSAAYRIVQESLSNVARHAGARTAAVVVRREPGALIVEVTDDGRAPAAPVIEGHGLVGMRERAAGLGGTLEAGPHETGGWRVAARLPTRS